MDSILFSSIHVLQKERKNRTYISYLLEDWDGHETEQANAMEMEFVVVFQEKLQNRKFNSVDKVILNFALVPSSFFR